MIIIKKIGVNWAVVEGVQLTDIAKGPGHYPGTPLPGQIGNAAIAGHRTTHGAPFYRVDELVPGDQIVVKTLAGTYTYVVYKKPFAVQPTDYGVVANTPDARAHAHELQPALLRRRAHHHQGASSCGTSARKPHQPPKRRQRVRGSRRRRRQAARDRTAGRVEQCEAVGAVGLHRRDGRLPVVVGLPPLAPPAHVDDRA